ncbi:MAG: oligoendopeptidase F [Chloroflexi bacterium]|nr:oligoendopeptidase F [Chloroflexota bacterium]
MSATLPKRVDVPVADTWDLSLIYPTDAAWEADFRRVEGMVPALAALQGHVGESAVALHDTLRQRDALHTLLDQLMVYAHMRRDEDTANSTYQALNDRAGSLATRVSAAGAFLEPEILAIPDERLAAYLAEDADLRLYGHHLEELRRQRAHVRSVEVEEVLAQASEVGRAGGTVFGMLNNADLVFPTVLGEDGQEVELTKGRYIVLLESQDRRVREDAFRAMYATYGKVINTIGATLASSVKKDLFYARARRYDTCLAAAMEPDNIPQAVYHQLIEAVHRNLPHLHRYLRLRRRLLGLDELHLWDLYVPMVPEAQRQVPFEEAVQIVTEALQPLGDDYIRVMVEGLRSRWVDVYENQGKRSGAYSSGAYSTPPYILMNYQNMLESVFTLAHELGHSLHSHYSKATQPYVYGYYTIFVAEVASTLNEALLTHHLLATTDDRRFRMSIINRFLEQFRTTLYRQTMFAEFELLTHQRAEAGQALTPEWLSAEYKALNERYYAAEVVIDDPIRLEWSRIPHFYSAFYVYKYATGLSAAVALAEQILREGAPAVERYLAFLRGGSSAYSIDLLKGAGIDMTTSAPVDEALATFGRYVAELEELAGA